MRGPTPWPWVVLAVWSTWLQALVGRLGSLEPVQGFAPDLGLVLLLVLEPRLVKRDAYLAAILLGLTRAAFSADPASAILVGTLAAVAVSRTLRAFIEVDGVLVRTLLAGGLALVHGAFLAAVHFARLDPALGLGFAIPGAAVLRAALATALAASIAAPALGRLPGLRPLFRDERGSLA